MSAVLEIAKTSKLAFACFILGILACLPAIKLSAFAALLFGSPTLIIGLLPLVFFVPIGLVVYQLEDIHTQLTAEVNLWDVGRSHLATFFFVLATVTALYVAYDIVTGFGAGFNTRTFSKVLVQLPNVALGFVFALAVRMIHQIRYTLHTSGAEASHA